MSEGPIFVVGSMRSGSTLLRLVLDSHPDIAIGAETGFMGALRGTREIPNWKLGKEWYTRLNWTEQEFDERLRVFYGGMFERYAGQQGKRRWGEKTPFHTAHIAEMARVFPDAVFVGIVRHPGAVAMSLRRNFHYTFTDAVSYWQATNLDLVRAGSDLGERFAACRYEDLVMHSEAVLREIVTFVGEPWSANLLAHQQVHRERGAPRITDGSTSSRDPIDPARTTHWLRHTAEEDRRALDGVSGLCGFFGYEPAVATIGPWPSDEYDVGRRTATGADLAARRRLWADRVDFDDRPPAPIIDASPGELADRLARAEAALNRARARRAVRVGNAIRKIQHDRSVGAVREAWSLMRRPQSGGKPSHGP